MTTKLEQWARIKRTAMREELAHLKAGGKILSPSGDDITARQTETLEAHLEHVNMALKEIEDADRT